jgi:cyanophycin synthetase
MGHVLEHVAIELQNIAGDDVTFGKTRGAGDEGVYNVVFEYGDPKVGVEAGRLALTLLESLLPADLRTDGVVSDDFTWEDARDSFIRFAQRNTFGPSTASLVRAAEERNVPWLRLNEYSLVQFGHGKYQQRIQATITSRTPHIAVEMASDKEETNRILGDLGLPVPRQRLVYSEQDARRAAERIGYPVVVKPFNANHGRGVSLNLNDAEHTTLAFTQAREFSRGVIVESMVRGFDHRILVIDGEMVAVAKRVPGHVVGDGVRSIAALVDEVNSDPRRGIGHEKVLTRIEFDYQANRLLTLLGYTQETVPAAGEIVYLRLTEDISQSYKETGGAICEVNAAPGFRMHTHPSEGTSRDVAARVMDMLFPSGSPARIPILAVTGTNGKTTTVRMLAHIYKMAGNTVGLATTDGIYIDGQRTVEGDMTGPIAARMVLRDPAVDVAVLETARGGLLRAGMGFKKANVAACLNVREDHLGLRGIDTVEQLAEVKRIVIEVAKDTAVLNADDPLCLRMADYTDAEHVCYVTMNPAHELVREHIQRGGRGVVLEQGIAGHMITIYEGGAHIPLLWTHLVPATLEGKALHNVQNAMFAAAMAFSGGLKLEDIRHGLQTFDATFFQAPGRLNIYDEHPFTVLLDYAHNPHALEQVCSLVGRMDVRGRRIGVLSAPGDRRDQDIGRMAEIAAGAFDLYVCRRDDALRGRKKREVPELLRDGLLAAGVDGDHILVVPDEYEAVETALRLAAPGDLLVLFADALTRTWEQVVNFEAEAATTTPATTAPRPTGLPDVPAVDVDLGELIRDERGVRLAREAED